MREKVFFSHLLFSLRWIEPERVLGVSPARVSYLTRIRFMDVFVRTDRNRNAQGNPFHAPHLLSRALTASDLSGVWNGSFPCFYYTRLYLEVKWSCFREASAFMVLSKKLNVFPWRERTTPALAGASSIPQLRLYILDRLYHHPLHLLSQ